MFFSFLRGFSLGARNFKKTSDPLISEKKNCSDYRVHGIQNDRLGLTVSTQKSVLKNEHRVPRYCKMCQKSGRQTKPANFGTFWPIFQWVGI